MKEAEKSVIVHCNEGVNRTSAVLGCFFILHYPFMIVPLCNRGTII